VTTVSAQTTPRQSPSVLDLQPPGNRAAHLWRVPSLVVEALRIVWRAGRRHLCTTAALQVVAAAGVAVQLLLSKQILSGLVDVSNGASVSSVYVWFALLAGLTAALGMVGAYLAHEQKLLAELTARHAFDSIIAVAGRVDYQSFEQPDFFDQLQRARNSGMYRTMDMVNSVLLLTTGVLTSISIALVLVVLQPLLLVFVALATVFPLLAAIRNGRRSYTFEYGMTAESRERLYVMEMLTGREQAKEIRVFGAGPFLRARWDALTDERLRQVRIFLRSRLKVALVGSSAGAFGMAIGLVALLYLLTSGRMEVAAALTAGLAMQQLGNRLTSVTGSVGSLIESGMFVDDYKEFLALAPAAQPVPAQPGLARVAPPAFQALRVENVSFSYPSSARFALQNVSLEIEPGEIVALVGENGSGKTTLVKLICQLYRPNSGRVLWNGVDVATLSPEAVRGDMTVLFQDYNQYYLSALDNIVIGRPELADDLDRAHRAAERAGAAGFLEALPEGLSTRLGPQFFGGHELSVGQWQRLALARAFFRAGRFLVLDEPTASLDPRAESELYEQMRDLAGGRSVLLVSHRFSSVRSADRIYVLQNGRVTESGSHAELMAEGGTYAELFTFQADAYLGGTLVG